MLNTIGGPSKSLLLTQGKENKLLTQNSLRLHRRQESLDSVAKLRPLNIHENRYGSPKHAKRNSLAPSICDVDPLVQSIVGGTETHMLDSQRYSVVSFGN